MSRVTSSSSKGIVGIQDTDGNPITAVDGALKVSSLGFSELAPGYPTQVSVDNTSTVLLAANPDRKYAHIFNNTTNYIFIQFEASAALNQGIKINPGNYFTITGDNLWLGAVNGIALIPGQLIDVLEGI